LYIFRASGTPHREDAKQGTLLMLSAIAFRNRVPKQSGYLQDASSDAPRSTSVRQEQASGSPDGHTDDQAFLQLHLTLFSCRVTFLIAL